MSGLKAKNILHAQYVDRIAIVDKPAVPDAMIVAYKRDTSEQIKIADAGTEWNHSEALERVQKWAIENAKIPGIDEKLNEAFVSISKSETGEVVRTGLIADVSDNDLVIIPKALTSLYQDGVSQILKSLSAEDKTKVCERISKKASEVGLTEKYGEVLKALTESESNAELVTETLTRFVLFSKRNQLYGTCESMISILFDIFWSNRQTDEVVDALFSKFKEIILSIGNQKIEKIEKSDSRIAVDQIISAFDSSSKFSVIESFLGTMKNYLVWLIMDYDISESGEAISKLIDIAKNFVKKNMPGIKAEKSDKSNAKQINKVGRAISSARMDKLKNMASLLQEVIQEGEADTIISTDQGLLNKESPDMDVTQITKSLEDLKSSLEQYVKSLPAAINALLVEKGLVLTEDKKLEKENAEKAEKESIEEKLNEEKIAKEKFEKNFAEFTANIEKMRADVDAITKRFAPVSASANLDPIPVSKSTKGMTLDEVCKRDNTKKK